MSSEDFDLVVLVGGEPLPKYEKDGVRYIESQLHTPHSYLQRFSCFVEGEDETQVWPVTPYQIRVTASIFAPACYYRLYVDGYRVKTFSLEPGQGKVVKGFRDGRTIREFLFSLPRPRQDKLDTLPSVLQSHVGTVRVDCFNGRKVRSYQTDRSKRLGFRQANKSDGYLVTGGEYTLATTKVGEGIASTRALKNTDFWKVGNLRSSQTVKYVMGHTLEEMGLKPERKPLPLMLGPSVSESSGQSGPAGNASASSLTSSASVTSVQASNVSSTSCCVGGELNAMEVEKVEMQQEYHAVSANVISPNVIVID